MNRPPTPEQITDRAMLSPKRQRDFRVALLMTIRAHITNDPAERAIFEEEARNALDAAADAALATYRPSR